MTDQADQTFDVAIVGGGPGGCATALSLRQHDPSISVVLLEATDYAQPRIGETLPPPTRQLLEHLGVWDQFLLQSHQPVHGTSAAWGQIQPADNDFLLTTGGTGWHVDRAAFDAMLCQAAQLRGTTVIRNTQFKDATRVGAEEPSPSPGKTPRWRLHLANQTDLNARIVVDATGRSASFSRRQGATVQSLDRLVGICQFRENRHHDPRTMVEATADGWWYTASLPQNQRIVAFMTDADIASTLRLTEPDRWQQQLAATVQTSEIAGQSRPLARLFVRPIESRCLSPAAGTDWLAVGDAASTFDPLSSQGILKTLRGGIFASYAIADLLSKRDPTGLDRYRSFIVSEFSSYATIRARYYGDEQRWPEHPFWKRRHSMTASLS